MTRENAGKTWLKAERDALTERFAQGMDLEALADAHGRTASAILGKLVEMGLLIVNRNGFYFKIDPDPWTGWLEAKRIDTGLDATDTKYKRGRDERDA